MADQRIVIALRRHAELRFSWVFRLGQRSRSKRFRDFARAAQQLFRLAPFRKRVRYFVAPLVMNSGMERRRQSQKAEGSAMNSFTAIVSILAAAAAVTFAITAYVN